jgi:LMBR1-like membrane protein
MIVSSNSLKLLYISNAYGAQHSVTHLTHQLSTLIFTTSLTNTESTVWEYYWHLYYSPILLRALSIVLGILSLFSFLGVISTMTGVSNSSSVYFQAVHRGTPSFSGVLIFILVTMGYAVYVTLWALFQMQFAGMMHLVPHRTSAVCLSFNARMCARLAAPMAFFYLGEITTIRFFSSLWLTPVHVHGL